MSKDTSKLDEIFEDIYEVEFHQKCGDECADKQKYLSLKADLLAWHREKVRSLLDKYDCQVAHCHDGHLPVQSSEDGDVDWVGCDNCTSGKVRLEPYATIAELRASLEEK